jgi:hypothetical protein
MLAAGSRSNLQIRISHGEDDVVGNGEGLSYIVVWLKPISKELRPLEHFIELFATEEQCRGSTVWAVM